MILHLTSNTISFRYHETTHNNYPITFYQINTNVTSLLFQFLHNLKTKFVFDTKNKQEGVWRRQMMWLRNPWSSIVLIISLLRPVPAIKISTHVLRYSYLKLFSLRNKYVRLEFNASLRAVPKRCCGNEKYTITEMPMVCSRIHYICNNILP